MIKFPFIITAFVVAGLTVCGCNTPKKADPVVTKRMEQTLLEGFDAIMSQHEKCDNMDAFVQMHTLQAQAALTALDDKVDPAFLEPGVGDLKTNRGAMWVCQVAKKAGFTKSNVKVLRHVIDPRSKLARIIFELRDGEYAFPMARLEGTWRSPFPGQLFLAGQYSGWARAIRRDMPADNAAQLLKRLKESAIVIRGYQPNWTLYPELGKKETDEVQLQIKENVRKTVGQ